MAEFYRYMLPLLLTLLILCVLACLRKSDMPLIFAQCVLTFGLFFLYFSEEMWLEASRVGYDLPFVISAYFLSILLLCNEYRVEFRYYSKKPSAFSASTCINTILSITIYFAMIYNLHSVAVPNSFNNVNTNDYLSRALEFYYFSLTTFTTVGFGDITAATTCARFLVLFEIAVYFYLMVIIVNFVYVVKTGDTNENIGSEAKSQTKFSKKKKVKESIFTSENVVNNNQPLTTEEIHKEIDLLQGCITRMASNSFYVKGWFISVYAVVLALMAEDVNHTVIFLVLLGVNLGFWWLDGYFLQAEKSYRNIYAWVLKKRPLGNRDLLYNLNPSCDRQDMDIVKTVPQIMLSPTLSIFYGIPLLCLVLFCIFRIVLYITTLVNCLPPCP